MEMTKGTSRSKTSESDALLRPSPFHADQERQELEQAFAASAPPMNRVLSCDDSQEVVATAIAISGDAFRENSLPMATATMVANNNGGRMSSAPSQQSDKSKEEVVVSSLSTNMTLPVAPSLPNNLTTPTQHQQATATLLRQAQHRGQVELEIEKNKDMFAKAQMNNLRKENAAALEVAKVNARKAMREDEGLTVDEGIHRNYAYDNSRNDGMKGGEEDKPVRPFGSTTKDGKRGYEVAEYNVAEYETSEYDVEEYKSVYD